MQTIYGPNTAANILLTAQKRLIRPIYAQTQGFPYAASIDPSLRNTDGSIRVPLSTDVAAAAAGGGTVPLTRSATVFTSQGSIPPGIVLTKQPLNEYVAISNEANAIQPFGLLGQWLGGSFDNIGQSNQVGVWMGPDSTYELLAPAWDDTGLAAVLASGAGSTTGAQVNLYAGTDGRLVYVASPSTRVAVARVIDRPSSSRLIIQLLI